MHLKIPLLDRLAYAWEAFSRTHKPDDAAFAKLNAMPIAEMENALRTHFPEEIELAAARIVAGNELDAGDACLVAASMYGVPWDAQRTVMACLVSKQPKMLFLPVVQKWSAHNQSRITAAFK